MKRVLSKAAKLSFCSDLVNAAQYAKRKQISITAVYYAIESGVIAPADIYLICGRQHWEWSKYSTVLFRDYKRSKDI